MGGYTYSQVRSGLAPYSSTTSNNITVQNIAGIITVCMNGALSCNVHKAVASCFCAFYNTSLGWFGTLCTSAGGKHGGSGYVTRESSTCISFSKEAGTWVADFNLNSTATMCGKIMILPKL